MSKINWIELDSQWQQRSQWLFQRCVNEPNMALAQLVWNAAIQSEKKRLEWKCVCLGQEEKEEILKAFATVEEDQTLFNL